jgi:Mrp family chromosome partitioning ATPase/capsular polysaccharide biosynthesis protein
MHTESELFSNVMNAGLLGSKRPASPKGASPDSGNSDAVHCAAPSNLFDVRLIVYFYAFRRRWKPILLLAALLFLLGVLLTICFFRYSYLASARLRLVSDNPALVYSDRESRNGEASDIDKANHRLLITTRPVVELALKKKSIAERDEVRDQTSPVEWLTGKILAKIVERSDIMQLDVKDSDPELSRLLCNAVAEAYREWCDDAHRQQSLNRIDELKKAHADKEAELLRQQAACAKRVEEAGGMDGEALAKRNELATQRLAAYRAEITRMQIELRRVETELSVMERFSVEGADYAAAVRELSPFAQNDALAHKLLLDLEDAERYAARLRSLLSPEALDRYSESYLADLTAARGGYLARLLDLRDCRQKALQGEISQLRMRIESAESEARIAEQEIRTQNTDNEKSLTTLIDIKIAKDDLRRTQEVLGELTRKIKEVEVELGSASRVALFQKATTPTSPSNKYVPYIVIFGVAILSLIPGLAIVIWDISRRIVGDFGDVAANLDLPILGKIPLAAVRKLDPSRPAKCSESLRRKLIDAAESLHTRILQGRNSGVRILMFCGTEKDEGAATLAREMAVLLANSNYRTVLVDADLRNPKLHKCYDIPQSDGICEMICGQTVIWDMLYETPVENLWIAPAGEWSERVHYAMIRGGVAQSLDTLRSIFDFVVIAGGPALAGAESQYFARAAEAIVCSIERDATRIDKAVESAEILRYHNSRVLGAAVAM